MTIQGQRPLLGGCWRGARGGLEDGNLSGTVRRNHTGGLTALNASGSVVAYRPSALKPFPRLFSALAVLIWPDRLIRSQHADRQLSRLTAFFASPNALALLNWSKRPLAFPEARTISRIPWSNNTGRRSDIARYSEQRWLEASHLASLRARGL